MADIKENVSIDIDRYNYLIRTEEKYRILTDALFNGASLDMYSKDRLVYNSNDIDTVLKALEGDDYECVIDSLIREEEGNGSN